MAHRHRSARLAVLVAGAALAVVSAGAVSAPPSGAATVSSPRSISGADWTVYHGSAAGTGVDTSGVSFTSPTAAWTSPVLDGKLYGEPLEATGRVFAATENDTVYALAADSGQVLWSTHLATPVPSGDLPCGNISPTVGITGTPVVDEGAGEIFAVADELVGGAPVHHLVGLDLYSGAVLLDQVVDPPGSDPAAQLQRTGLNLDNGQVIFGFGGNAGDCGTYHGWVEAVPESGGSARFYEVDAGAGEREGALWMGGAAPEVDASGNIWAAAGNGSNTSSSDPYDFSDSVFELSPSLGLDQYFAPTAWYSDNAGDADLGSTAPALLSNGTVVQVGKSQTAYLLNQAHLGGIGGQLTSVSACGSDADGGEAVSGTTVYVACRSGVEAFATAPSPPSLSVSWHSSAGDTDPPIVAGGLVWSIGGGFLYGLDPSTGAQSQKLSIGANSNSFPTPSVGDGLLLAPSSTQVHAFSGSAGLPGPPAPTPHGYWEVAADGGLFAFNAPFDGSMGGKPLAAPVVGMAADPATGGYWEVAADGGVFAFNAPYLGSMGGKPLAAPVVGIAAAPGGGGYWEVAADGGLFAFDAPFDGSMGGKPLAAPVVGIAAGTGGGYWEVAADGGLFAFEVPFEGSMGGKPLAAPMVGMVGDPSTGGYWEVAADGGLFAFNAPFDGSMGGKPLAARVVGMAALGS
ncbi:MAG TPA: PQQ-binding-like beta-propeller repeat protein [Acidimicrobiales bacterium]|nr:PQQ-binding-like beta-propeller repeat protein [Acidimicrobiales bacterium]